MQLFNRESPARSLLSFLLLVKIVTIVQDYSVRMLDVFDVRVLPVMFEEPLEIRLPKGRDSYLSLSLFTRLLA